MAGQRIRPSPDEQRWLVVLGTLNEAQARLHAAQKALEIGRGGITHVARITRISRPTIQKGIVELRAGGRVEGRAPGRVRRPGGGRKRIEAVYPQITERLATILEETTAGDPMSLLKWTSKSTRRIADEMTQAGCPMTAPTVSRCVRAMGYSLQANTKTLEGPQHPGRDSQFRYLNEQVKAFMLTGDPVISVDTKKKELVGRFRNSGRTWRPSGQPAEVFTHDFPDMALGKAIPYGTYDLARNQGFVNVGVSHDTARFAVESIHRWWRMVGRRSYPRAKRLLISADAGGSNGNRLRAWKTSLQQMADATGIAVTVCHYPPGTSKWNKIEHRMFSHISLNWRGQPLVSYETVVNLIANTRTRAGLTVKAVLDKRRYRTGLKISNAEMKALNLRRHDCHPHWNYTLSPRTSRTH